MKIHRNIEQGSPEWHELRVGKITGSTLKGVTVKDPSVMLYDIIAQRGSGMAPEFYINAAMQRGTETEPLARIAYEELTGFKVEQVGFISHGKYDFVGFSPDGIIETAPGIYSRAVEIKCPDTKTHVKYILNGILPSEYKSQVLSYFYNMPDLQVLDFISYDNRFAVKPIWVLPIKRESLTIELSEIDQAIPKFWAKVELAYQSIVF